jgi:hypothetical protein
MKKEMSQTLKAVSAKIDCIDRQRCHAQATAMKLEKPASNGFKTVFQEIGKRGGRYPLRCFKNAWYDCFFIHHDLTEKDNVPAVEKLKNMGSVEDELTIFLQVSEDLGSPCEADEVKRYCEGVRLEEVHKGLGEAGTRRAAWVDDRNSPILSGSGNVRLCQSPLTATGLLRRLKQPV